jgi:hypothetical protein
MRASPSAGRPECGQASDPLVYPHSGPEPDLVAFGNLREWGKSKCFIINHLRLLGG